MMADAIFDRLRAELGEPPSHSAFWKVLGLFFEHAHSDPEAFETLWLPLARSHLQHWRTLIPLKPSLGEVGFVDPFTIIQTNERALASASPRGFAWGLARTLSLSRKPRSKDSPPLQPKHGELLAQNTMLASFEGLVIAHQKLGEQGVAALLASPNLSQLAALSIRSCGVGARALDGVKQLESLEILDLSSNKIGAKGIEALAGWRVPELTHLDLSSNPLSSRGAALLARWPQLSHLVSLDLSYCKLRLKGLRELAITPLDTRLEALDLSFNHFGNHFAGGLAQSPLLAGVRRLNLRQNSLGDDGIRQILTSPYLTSLRTLDVSSNELGFESAKALAQCEGLANLTALDVGSLMHDERSAGVLRGSPIIGHLFR